MIKWLVEMLIGWPWCAHKWKVIKEGNRVFDGEVCGKYYDLQCEKCGDIKRRKTGA